MYSAGSACHIRIYARFAAGDHDDVRCDITNNLPASSRHYFTSSFKSIGSGTRKPVCETNTGTRGRVAAFASGEREECEDLYKLGDLKLTIYLQKATIQRFRERWEKLKESAKRKRSARAAENSVKETIQEEPELEENAS